VIANVKRNTYPTFDLYQMAAFTASISAIGFPFQAISRLVRRLARALATSEVVVRNYTESRMTQVAFSRIQHEPFVIGIIHR
jgi:hypothetical protein